MRRVRESGSPAPARFGGHRRPILDEHEALVRGLLDAKSDITLVEIQAELARRGVMVRVTSTILRWLRWAELTRRKSLRATEQDRPDVAHDRRRWRVWQRYMDPTRFVFLDETGATTNMVRRYGRCARGERLVDATPWGH